MHDTYMEMCAYECESYMQACIMHIYKYVDAPAHACIHACKTNIYALIHTFTAPDAPVHVDIKYTDTCLDAPWRTVLLV